MRALFGGRKRSVFGLGKELGVKMAVGGEFVQNGAIVSVPSLASPDMTFFFRNFNEGVEALSPTSRLFITQIGLEPVLRDRQPTGALPGVVIRA